MGRDPEDLDDETQDVLAGAADSVETGICEPDLNAMLCEETGDGDEGGEPGAETVADTNAAGRSLSDLLYEDWPEDKADQIGRLRSLRDQLLDAFEESEEVGDARVEAAETANGEAGTGPTSLSDLLGEEAARESQDHVEPQDEPPKVLKLGGIPAPPPPLPEFEPEKHGYESMDEAISDRLSDAVPEAAKLYDDNQEVITVLDDNCDGPAHYDSFAKGIRYNAEEDLANPTGAGSTYFHEVGHTFDHCAGNERTWLSSSGSFREAIERDVEDRVAHYMERDSCIREKAYETLSQELEGDDKSCVSDVFGSVTRCQCQGDYGHDPTYWELEGNVEKEAFANMFESSMIREKTAVMREYFPTAYEEFLRLIRSR